MRTYLACLGSVVIVASTGCVDVCSYSACTGGGGGSTTAATTTTNGTGGLGGGGAAGSDGTPCTSPNDCASGFCVDDRCCGSVCADVCTACAESLTGEPDGTCAPVLAGTETGECDAQSAASCGNDGTGCSGSAGQCRVHPMGTVCGAATCSMDERTEASACDGAGTCVGGAMTPCAPYKCMGAACASTCSSDIDCAASHFCDGAGACLSKKNLGQACVGGNECVSDECRDLVCCDSACAGTCQACSLAKTGVANGTCTTVKNGLDPDDECNASPSEVCVGGTCAICGEDPPPPGGACPAICNGGCASNVCVIDCTTATCPMAITCPAGFDCSVVCNSGSQRCIDRVINCPADYSCNVDCSGGSQSCKGNFLLNCSTLGTCSILCANNDQQCQDANVACGTDSCTATCLGAGNTPTLDNCAQACSCVPCT